MTLLTEVSETFAPPEAVAPPTAATEPPQDAAAMRAYIDTKADPEGRYRADLAAKRTGYAEALRQFEAAKKALTDHELTLPDADPVGWANKKRELSDALPVWESLLNQRRQWMETSARNLALVRRQVVEDINGQLHAARKRAWTTVTLEQRELERQIEKLKRGDHDSLRKVGRQSTALDTALRDFGLA